MTLIKPVVFHWSYPSPLYKILWGDVCRGQHWSRHSQTACVPKRKQITTWGHKSWFQLKEWSEANNLHGTLTLWQNVGNQMGLTSFKQLPRIVLHHTFCIHPLARKNQRAQRRVKASTERSHIILSSYKAWWNYTMQLHWGGEMACRLTGLKRNCHWIWCLQEKENHCGEKSMLQGFHVTEIWNITKICFQLLRDCGLFSLVANFFNYLIKTNSTFKKCQEKSRKNYLIIWAFNHIHLFMLLFCKRDSIMTSSM